MGRVTLTRETIYLDPKIRPVDLDRGSAKTIYAHFSAAIYDPAVVGMNGCGHIYAYINLAVL